MLSAQINKIKSPLHGLVELPRSKSAANRIMILDALHDSLRELNQYGYSKDIKYLHQILKNTGGKATLNAGDGGTTLRFALAYLCLRTEQTTYLMGSDRLAQRPIDPLIWALTKLGFKIDKNGPDNPFPIGIHPVHVEDLKHKTSIDCSQSSQFASALILIASSMPNGLILELKGSIVSRSYIEMTLQTLQRSGLPFTRKNGLIDFQGDGEYRAIPCIPRDWSAAAFFYGFAALLPGTSLKLKGLSMDSIQGDQVIALLYQELGVSTEGYDDGVLVQSREINHQKNTLKLNLLKTPDLAPPIIMTLALLGIPAVISGLVTLDHKESCRKKNIIEYLKVIHVKVQSVQDSLILPGTDPIFSGKPLELDAYNDHRMAMTLALISCRADVHVQQASCVEKSFPDYWKSIQNLGIPCQLIHS